MAGRDCICASVVCSLRAAWRRDREALGRRAPKATSPWLTASCLADPGPKSSFCMMRAAWVPSTLRASRSALMGTFMKRTTATTALAVFLAMLIPAHVLAVARFEYAVRANECWYEDGTWDAGSAILAVRVTEVGKSGANYFRTRSKFQGQLGWDFPWRLLADTGWQYSRSFPNDSATHYHTKWAVYGFEEGDRWAQTRVVMRVQIWSNRLGLLSEQTFRSYRC
jgi:hypothetical protein